MIMPDNILRKKLAAGQAVIGIGVRFCPSVEIAAMMASCGYDWLFVDLEHSTFSLETVSQISLAALTAGITPLVRVPAGEFAMGTRMLDGGAWGLVIPHINNAAEAREIVKQFKYPPLGERSAGPPIPQLGFLPPSKGTDLFNEKMLLVAMIETPEGVANAESIAAVPGIDVLLIGTNDLSLTMGMSGDLTNPKIMATYETVIAACKKHGKWPGAGGIYDDERIRINIAMGMRLIIAGGDYLFLASGARARAAALQDAVTATKASK